MTDGIPPHISLRALREALGVTLDELVERIGMQGVTVTKPALSNIETGKRRASDRLMNAWTKALNTSPIYVQQDRELRTLVGTWDDRNRKDRTKVKAAA